MARDGSIVQDMRGLAILGPTCSGKSALALELARRLGAEIVSCDSMQIYRGLDIGTAKPTAAERVLAPHHLLDILDLSQPFNANLYCDLANACIKDISGRGRQAILAGGTGLYAKTLIYGLRLPPAERALAAELAVAAATPAGCAAMLEELGRAAAPAAVPAAIAANPRRLARAVEILRLTGRVPWDGALAHGGSSGATASFRQFVILPELAFLRRRIEARCRQMFADGWVDEVRNLLGQGLAAAPTARHAIGYAEIAAALLASPDAPPDTDALAAAVSARTIRYARRQLTWFRHQHPGACLLPVTDEAGLAALPEKILADLPR